MTTTFAPSSSTGTFETAGTTHSTGSTAAVDRLVGPVPVTAPSAFARVEQLLAGLLAKHSITALRVSLGLVFLAFGALKLFPGMSPAADIATRTLETLTFGLLSGGTALLTVAVVEIVIGLTLVSGLFLRTGLVVMAGAMVGIMSPLVLFFDELFPNGEVTLMAQYVVKDIVLVAAALVVGARALGARLVPPTGR